MGMRRDAIAAGRRAIGTVGDAQQRPGLRCRKAPVIVRRRVERPSRTVAQQSEFVRAIAERFAQISEGEGCKRKIRDLIPVKVRIAGVRSKPGEARSLKHTGQGVIEPP